MEELFELFYQCSGISTDTRNIRKDCLFVCLKGANFNGNTFAEKALENGAKYVIVDEKEFQTNPSIYLVENSLVFLQKLANYHRTKYDIPVIGITGSNGKTSTKELINAVLSKKYNVLATTGNLNNHIGVPLTLLQLNTEHDIAIIEMGANKFKDIEELCEIAKPNFGIITNIGKAHLEGFVDFEGVLKTKRELFESVHDSNGKIIYNGDDTILSDQVPENIESYNYGTQETSFVKGNLIGLTPFVKLSWKISNYESPAIETGMIGKYNFYNFLAAITFGIVFKVPHELINEAIAQYKPDNKRSQIKKTTKNTLILDCYNANPTSMKSALESFSMIDTPKKIFIIGDMLELGDQSLTEHKSIINYIEHSGLNGFTVGPIFNSLISPNVIESFADINEAKKYFAQHDLDNALILLKGSRGIGLEVLEENL